MEEKEKLAIAQDWVRKLANGINPLTGNAVKEDDVVNNVHISRCLFYVAELLSKHTEKTTKVDPTRNKPFVSSAIQVEKYNYVDAISISAFAREIKNLLPENMQAISNTSLINWLLKEGLLYESEPDSKGRSYKVATEKGNKMGIYSEDRERNGGHYLITLYNREAQKYLLEHLEEISKMQ